jgi:hypothetical protein
LRWSLGRLKPNCVRVIISWKQKHLPSFWFNSIKIRLPKRMQLIDPVRPLYWSAFLSKLCIRNCLKNLIVLRHSESSQTCSDEYMARQTL